MAAASVASGIAIAATEGTTATVATAATKKIQLGKLFFDKKRI
jgi:hypothetical protein